MYPPPLKLVCRTYSYGVSMKAENWITIEGVELHTIVKRQQYEESGVISFVPLDACKFEFMRFRYR